MSEIKRLLNSLLWEIYGRIPSNISQKHTKNRYASMHPRIYEPRLLQKLNVKILNDICAILKLEIRLISRYLERVLISRDKNRTQQTILYGFLDIIVSSRIGESSREMRFNLSPPSGRAKGHGDADQSVIADEGNSSSDFNQWLHAMKMVARLPGGMPPEFRRKLWLALAEKYLKSKNVDWEKEEIKCFSEQWREDDVELGIQIVKDLHRTGSSLCSGPAGTINQAKLKRILLGYARYNPEVGYCQGFNMLGALILQVMDKEEIESIKVMIYLVEGILPRGYFSGSLGGLQADMAVFRELMTCKLPRLAKHLQKLQGPVENAYEPPLTNVFTMQWFLTMFCTCLPMTCVLRVWDLVLIEGSDVLLRTALVLWSLLEERILSAKTADDFYCKMGSFSSELLNGHLIDSNGLIEKVVDLGPIPELQKLRDKHLYNISPFRNKKGLQLYYSDEEGDSDEDSRMAVATAWGLRLSRRGSTGLSNKTDSKDRIALDISLLKKQYDRLRERQRQAHIILTSAVARQGSNPNQSTIQMNQLLIGRNAIVTNNGRRLGPPQGAIPPARRPHSTAKSPKPTHSKSTRHGETLHWRDTDLSRRRRGSVKWKDIKSDSSQSASGQEDRTSQLTGSAHSSRSSSSEPTSHRAPVKTHQRSDSSSYSEDSDGNSSTSTSLCDEDEHEAGDLNASSLEDSPIRKSKSNKKHSEVPHKKCLEDVLNSNEKQHTVDSQIPFIQLTTMESPVLNANKTDIDAIDYGKEDSETESSRLSYAGFVDEFNWTDLNEIRSAEPLKAITVDVTSNESDLLALTKTITSTSQLSPIPDITTYINNSSISPLRTPISAFDFTDTISSEDNSRQFNVNDEGVTNEYFERVNIVERPTKLDLLYSLNEEDSIRNAFLDKTPSYQSSPDRESSKETSSLESSQFLSSKSSTKNVPSTSQELDRKMKVLLEYSNQSSLSFIAEAKHELSLGKFKEKNPDLPSFNYQSPGFLSISDTEVKSFIKPVTTTSSEFDTITESSITGYSSLTGVENGETNLSPKEKETFMHTVGQEVATSSDLVDTVQPTEKSVPNIENRIPLTEDLEKRFEALEMSFQSRVKASINTQDPGIETGVTAESSTTEQESNDMSNPSEILKTPTESIKHAVSLRTTLEKQLEKTCEDKVSDKTSLHDTSQMETVELKEMSDTSDLMKTPWDSLTNEQSIKESTKDPQLSDLSNTKYIFDISPVDDKLTVGDGTSIRNAYSFSTELQSSATGIMNKDKEQNSYSETECEKFEAQSQSFPTSPLQYSDDHFGHSEMETKCEGPSSTDKDTNNTVVCIEEMLNPTPVSSSSVTQSLPNYSENHFGDKGTSPPELEKQAKHQNTALTHPLDIHNDEKRICNATLKDDKTTKPANNETTDYEFKFKPLEKQISEKLLSISKVSEMELKNEIPTGLKTEKVVKGPDIIINNDIKPRINISESLPVSTALEEKSMKHIPSTADLEHRFRELERKLSSPNLTSSTKQADAKTMTSPLSTGPHLILSVVKTTSDNTTDDKANEQPPSIRKRIPSTEDLETRFNALEIEKALKSPVSGPSNLLSPLQAKNDIFVSHQTTAVSVMNKKPDIPSTEDLEQRFQALEQSKLVQKTHSDDKGDVMRSRSTKAELITEPAVSTKDTFSQDGKETQLIPIAVKETKVDSSSRANKILPTTQDLEARFEQLTQKKSITKHLTQSPETPTITIENKSQVVKSSVTNIKTTRFGEQTTSSMEHEDSKEVTPIIPPLIIEHKKEEADCIPIALEKKIYSGITDKEHKKREPDHTATPFESKVTNLPEPDFTPKLLDLKISSPIELEQQSNPGLDPIEHEDKKLEPEYISQSADFKMIMSKPTTLGDQELLKANDSAHSPTEIDSIATSPVTALKVNKIQEEECLTDESTPIVEQQKLKDLYKIESQSDETLTIGDQTNTEFDPRAESRPTSCPEYRDPFDVNVITTDRVLKIIEENSKILHRILKKTLADSGDMENNAQPSKTINPSQIADSLSVLGNSIPSNTDSISPSRIISHSWLRSSFTLRSDDNISDRLASIKNTIKSIDTLCEEKSFRKEKCQRYIDSLFASPSKTIETPANPLIKVDDFENQPSQERTSKRELKKDISPRRRRNDDREEYESRVRRDMMPNSVDTCSDHSLSSIGNIDQVDREVDSINEGIEAGPQAQRPLSPYYGSGYDLNKRSITPVVYIPTKLEIRHTTVTSTFYDRYLTEKQIEKTFPKSKRSPMSPTLTKSYLEISSYSTTSTLNNQSSKSAENSPSRRRTAGAISPNDPVATANNKRNLLSTLDNATSDLHIRSCDNILLQMKSTTNNNKDYNPLPVKLRKPPEVAINLGLYKDYSSNESSKS